MFFLSLLFRSSLICLLFLYFFLSSHSHVPGTHLEVYHFCLCGDTNGILGKCDSDPRGFSLQNIGISRDVVEKFQNYDLLEVKMSLQRDN